MRPTHRWARYARQDRRITNENMRLRGSFLGLPGEIRNQIYQLALVRDDSLIALWPTQNLDAKFLGYHRSLKHHHRDLRYVQRKLATGLLRTCRQVRSEAAPFFWGGNGFDFSGVGGWHGLLRFLLTIGEDAREHVTQLWVEAPLFMEFTLERKGYHFNAVNLPHPRWTKLPLETGYSFGDEIIISREQEDKVMLQAYELLSQLKNLQHLTFEVGPHAKVQRWTNSYGNPATGMQKVISSLEEVILHLELLKKLQAQEISFILRKGSTLLVEQGVQSIVNLGWNFACTKESQMLITRGDGTSRWCRHQEVAGIQGRKDGTPKLMPEDDLLERSPRGSWRKTALWNLSGNTRAGNKVLAAWIRGFCCTLA